MGARFSALVQTGPEVQLTLCAMGRGIPGLFPRGNWPGCGVIHPALSSTEVKDKVELYFCPILCAFMSCYSVTFTFPLLLHIMYKTFLVSWQLQTY